MVLKRRDLLAGKPSPSASDGVCHRALWLGAWERVLAARAALSECYAGLLERATGMLAFPERGMRCEMGAGSDINTVLEQTPRSGW